MEIFIAVGYSKYCRMIILRCVVGFKLEVVLVLLVAGHVFIDFCLAGVDDVVDGLGVVELEIHVICGRC